VEWVLLCSKWLLILFCVSLQSVCYLDLLELLSGKGKGALKNAICGYFYVLFGPVAS
jgi:hypothetical protein